MRRPLAALAPLLVLGVLVVLPDPAQAHASLVSTDPAAGSTVSSLPRAVTLRFSEPVRAPATIVVTGPSGQRVSVGDAAVLGERVTERLVGTDAGPGAYTIGYQVLSGDGHVVNGTKEFTVAGGGASRSPAATASPARPSVLLSALALTGLVMLALAGVGRLSRGLRA